MKTILVVLGILAIGAPARAQLCGPDVRLTVKHIASKSTLEQTPPKDQARLYVLDPASELTGGLQMKISVDREWAGVLQAKSYFVVPLSSGHHEICMKVMNDIRSVSIDAVAGATYFLEAATIPTELRQVDEADGKLLLEKCRRTEFTEK